MTAPLSKDARRMLEVIRARGEKSALSYIEFRAINYLLGYLDIEDLERTIKREFDKLGYSPETRVFRVVYIGPNGDDVSSLVVAESEEEIKEEYRALGGCSIREVVE